MTTTADNPTTRQFRLTKGLDLPLEGAPEQRIEDAPVPETVCLLGDDYLGMRPTMHVREGDLVKTGQVLFEDKRNKGVNFTAPGAGRVVCINRGAKRRFESIVIDLDGEAAESFTPITDEYLAQLPRQQVVEALLQSGLWTAIRARPYGKIPSPESVPHSIFVSAIDTNPLAADPSVVLREPEYDRWFVAGLQALSVLTDGPLHLCTGPQAEVPGRDEECVQVSEFSGPHPAGLVGTHIHFLDPVNGAKTVWHIGYQDVVAVGRLLLTGEFHLQRVVSLAGPVVKEPRLIMTRPGAAIRPLVADAYEGSDVRVISGSVLSGRKVAPPCDHLGRYHSQISILSEGREREFLGWMLPGFDQFSVTKAFASALAGVKALAMSTSTHGSVRAIVPIGSYEKVMPLDIIPTALLKALLVQDTESAQSLGCLELIEEDLALCGFACPGKNDYGSLLRECLTRIETEG